jgi:hypothetical protein
LHAQQNRVCLAAKTPATYQQTHVKNAILKEKEDVGKVVMYSVDRHVRWQRTGGRDG